MSPFSVLSLKEKFNPQKADLLLNELYPGKNKSVPDPWYGTEPVFHDAYKIIERACEQIINKYASLPAER